MRPVTLYPSIRLEIPVLGSFLALLNKSSEMPPLGACGANSYRLSQVQGNSLRLTEVTHCVTRVGPIRSYGDVSGG